MSKRKSEERTFSSFEDLVRDLLPNEALSELDASTDAGAFGQALAAESLSVMERALQGPSRSRR